MKFRRFLSSLLFGAGCALIFIGILALILPSLPNPQFKLVMASFSMPSDSTAVSMMNRFMTFAFEQGWQMVGVGALISAASAWLLIRFTPKQHKPQISPHPKTAAPAPLPYGPAPEQIHEPSNPFAVSVCNDPLFTEVQSSATSFALHAEPILERNKIEEATEAALPADAQPSFSIRLAAETRAIETQVGAPSQSGSRILVRSVYEPEHLSKTPPLDESASSSIPSPVKPDSEIPDKSPLLGTPAPLPSLPSRIRSTMGHRSTNISKFPSSHS